MIATPHLQAYYRMETGGTDGSGKGNHLTNYGTTFPQGKVGNCADFDGVDDRLDGGDVLNLGTDSWFMSFWINPDTTAGVMMVFGKGVYAGAAYRYAMYYDANKIHIICNTMVDIPINASYTPAGQWSYVELSITREYVNGLNYRYVVNCWINREHLIVDYTDDYRSPINSQTPFPFRIGCYTVNDPTYPPNLFFNGKIDEFVMYNKLMSDSDRNRIYLGMHPLNG